MRRAVLISNRGDKIRTCDLLVPNQTRYQPAPRPVDRALRRSSIASDFELGSVSESAQSSGRLDFAKGSLGQHFANRKFCRLGGLLRRWVGCAQLGQDLQNAVQVGQARTKSVDELVHHEFAFEQVFFLKAISSVMLSRNCVCTRLSVSAASRQDRASSGLADFHCCNSLARC